ncbi:hypothetical protein Nepgr_017354 [Nepenthes gracilis]|uniref:Uncharacterized protein n=1 Tax=Nepenthes gracilis TaxID=150966 RepID=A0AAD3SP97_NEPGR|nr:hypothetical protein Nepgr_017354 [Nepenthes gracilis]
MDEANAKPAVLSTGSDVERTAKQSTNACETCSISPLLGKSYSPGKLCSDDDRIKEIEEDEDDFTIQYSMPSKFCWRQMLPKFFFDSLSLKERQTINDLIEKCLLAVIEEKLVEFKSSSLLDVADQHCFLEEATPPSKKDGTWKHAKSRRHRKSSSKNPKGSLGKYVENGMVCTDWPSGKGCFFCVDDRPFGFFRVAFCRDGLVLSGGVPFLLGMLQMQDNRRKKRW